MGEAGESNTDTSMDGASMNKKYGLKLAVKNKKMKKHTEA